MGLRKLTSPYTSIRALATGSNGNGHHPNGHHPATGAETTAGRKADHLRINVEEDVAVKGVEPGFDAFRFVHLALPELDLADVTTATELFGRRLGAPILISCMTGGTKEAERINLTLAEVAQAFGLPMGLGSGRVLLERPELRATFAVRRAAPDILLFCNLGAVQLNRGVGVAECQRLVEMTGADALVLHFNPLQEALQPAGDTCFGGLLPKICALCAGLGVPVVTKEVGWGLAPDVVRALLDAGVAAIDVAGAGGTSWSEVERHRMAEPWRARVAAAFAGWGMPTAEALVAARQVAPEATIIASGGLATGLDVAKALALGADLTGLAGPFLRAAAAGPDVAADLSRELIETLRVAMFCVGAGSLHQLRGTPRLVREGQPAIRLHREQLAYATPGSAHFLDITDDIAAVVARSGVQHGLVHVYSRHTTAAVRINENEPLLLADFQRLLGRLVPLGGFEHDDLARRVNVPPDEPIVSIAGGEPLIHREIDQIAAALVARRKFVYLCTNALLLEKKLDLFTPSPYFAWSVHLDGLRERHDQSVCRTGVFDKAVAAVKEAKRRGFRVTTNTTFFAQDDAQTIRDVLDFLNDELEVDTMQIAPGYAYEKAPDQEHFLSVERTHAIFRAAFADGRRKKWRLNHTPLYLDFLEGNVDFRCTAWGIPCYSVFGWQRPCYLLADGYAGSYRELLEETDWDRYGRGHNPKCANCMAHCGYEPTAVVATMASPKESIRAIAGTIAS